VKIKKCPCGGEAKVSRGCMGDDIPFVYCAKCGREGYPWAKESEAIKDWNAALKVKGDLK